MARPPSKHPTELELEILKIIWRDGPAGVRQVCAALAPTRKLAYTSVMTIMNIMTGKGTLAREKREGAYVYRPQIGEQATRRRMLGSLVERLFAGSAEAAMLSLLEAGELEAAELARLRALIDERLNEEDAQ